METRAIELHILYNSYTPHVPPAAPVNYSEDVHSMLSTAFQHSCFRSGQEEIIDTVLASRDVFVCMPTGSGESLLYQLLTWNRCDSGGDATIVIDQGPN